MPKVLIVILNYLTYEMTLELIQDLAMLDYADFDIMVVDNASPNESATVLSKHADTEGYFFYANEKNNGYAAGNNIGIRYGIEHGYTYTWILNNDVRIVDNNILRYLVNIGETHEDIACIGPRICNLDGNVTAPYCDRSTIWDLTLGLVSAKNRRKRAQETSQRVYRIFGCCMLLKNNVMNTVGCMDERTFLYCEEEILAERMLKAGYSTYYLAECSIIHMESSSIKRSKTSKRRQADIISESMKLYLTEYRGFSPFIAWLCIVVRRVLIFLR